MPALLLGTNSTVSNNPDTARQRYVGKTAAGLVIAKAGTGWAFLSNGISFGAVLLSMYLLRVHELKGNERPSELRAGFLEALNYVWARSDLRSILIMLVLVGVFGMNFPIFTSTMAVTVFHSDARGFGLLSSMMAFGTIGGALMAAKRDKPKFGTLCLGTGVFGIGCALAAFSPGYWWFGAALALIGAAAITFMTATNSIIQLSTERTMRGRVVAIGMGVMLGGTAMGAPIVGWVASHFGPRCSLGIAAVSAFAAALIAARMMTEHICAVGDGYARTGRRKTFRPWGRRLTRRRWHRAAHPWRSRPLENPCAREALLHVSAFRRSVQICPPQPFLVDSNGLEDAPSRPLFLAIRDFPKLLLSGKRVGDRDASNLLSILKIFTIKNSTLTFDCRSDDQRIVPRQLKPSSNS